MTALPPLTASENRATVIEAYSLCLRTEQDASEEDMVSARMIGYMLLHCPSSAAQECVANDVIKCVDQQARLQLGKAYIQQFVRPFKKYKGRTPIPTPRTPSFDLLKESIKTQMEKHPQNHVQAKETALIRDGFRCMVTRHYDEASVGKDRTLLQEVIDNPDSEVQNTHCCHIFRVGESTNADISPLSAKLEYAASSWTLLQRLGYSNLLEELNGKNIHRLENIMTMSTNLHNAFDRLQLWFEATDELNCYTVKLREDVHPCRLNYPPTTVTFTTTNTDLPLPSPLHAACAKIAYLSGEST